MVRRNIQAVDLTSQLFIVGEAYAENQVRLTGINWFRQNGRLGPSGRNIEQILGAIGYTVHPPVQVQLADGSAAPKQHTRSTVYTTDIFPCYPPEGGAPTTDMISSALKKEFLVREFEIMHPRVILLLGQHSYDAFFSTILHDYEKCSISAAFHALNPATILREYRGAKVVPFLHPSPASLTFSRWFSQVRQCLHLQPQIQAIAKAIEC